MRALFDAGVLPLLRRALDALNPEILEAAAKCAVAIMLVGVGVKLAIYNAC